jgi:hypothetical protein
MSWRSLRRPLEGVTLFLLDADIMAAQQLHDISAVGEDQARVYPSV